MIFIEGECEELCPPAELQSRSIHAFEKECVALKSFSRNVTHTAEIVRTPSSLLSAVVSIEAFLARKADVSLSHYIFVSDRSRAVLTDFIVQGFDGVHSNCIECVICHEGKFFYSDFLMCPGCQHAICKECLKNGDLLKCPQCRKDIEYGGWDKIPEDQIQKLKRENQNGGIDVKWDS